MNEDDRLKIQKELLWGLYQEYRNHARHNETMRANIINYLIASSAGLVSLIALGGLHRDDSPLTIVLMAVGLLGFLFSASYTERSLGNKHRANQVIDKLDSLWFKESPNNMADIKRNADKDREGDKLFLVVRVASNSHVLWLIFPLLISLIGVILTVFIYKN